MKMPFTRKALATIYLLLRLQCSIYSIKRLVSDCFDLILYIENKLNYQLQLAMICLTSMTKI